MVGINKNTDDSFDRRYCTICGKRSYVKKMYKVWLGLIQDYKWYCPNCLSNAVDENFVVLDKCKKVNVPLYSSFTSNFS